MTHEKPKNHCNLRIAFQTKFKSIKKTLVFLRSSIIYINSSAVAAMVPSVAKLTSIFKSRNANPQFLLLLGRELHLFCNHSYEILSAIWYQLCTLKNVKNTHVGMLLLVKLQARSLQLY